MTYRRGFSFVGLILFFALVIGGVGLAMLSDEDSSVLDFAEQRNDERRKDVATIMNAVYQSINDEKTEFLSGITVTDMCAGMSENEICKNGNCDSMVDLSGLIEAGYFQELPVDPSADESEGTGYYIKQNEEGVITVCAPFAESGETVSVTR